MISDDGMKILGKLLIGFITAVIVIALLIVAALMFGLGAWIF